MRVLTSGKDPGGQGSYFFHFPANPLRCITQPGKEGVTSCGLALETSWYGFEVSSCPLEISCA